MTRQVGARHQQSARWERTRGERGRSARRSASRLSGGPSRPRLALAERDPTLGQVVGRELDADLVSRNRVFARAWVTTPSTSSASSFCFCLAIRDFVLGTGSGAARTEGGALGLGLVVRGGCGKTTGPLGSVPKVYHCRPTRASTARIGRSLGGSRSRGPLLSGSHSPGGWLGDNPSGAGRSTRKLLPIGFPGMPVPPSFVIT
jgi:hypothetical protein